MSYVYTWLITLVILIVIEIVTMGLTTIWFAGGALIALFLAVADLSIYIQTGVFFLVSIVLLVCTRPLAVKYFNRKVEKTNMDSIIGKKAIVLSEINNLKETGLVSLNGMEWSARAYEGESIIIAGAVVIVKAVEGVKLMVVEEGKEK